MDSICAIIDAQGFFVKDEFYPRELAVAKMNDSTIKSWEFSPPLKFEDLSPKEKERNVFVMKYTGLPYDCKGLGVDKVKFIMGVIRENCWFEEKPNFGLKNNQFAGILKSIGFPYIVIDCPPIYALKPAVVSCNRHTLNPDGACSVKKVEILRNWVKNLI